MTERIRALATLACFVASLGCTGTSEADATPKPGALTIAVVGDSISTVQILAGSPIPCGWPTTIACNYSFDSSIAYPTIVGQRTGDAIVNLAKAGSRTVDDITPPGGAPIPSALNMVPSIPRAADVVVFESGTNDVSASGISPQLLDRADTVVAAIRKQAPHAKLIIIGVRYFNGCEPPLTEKSACRTVTVDAWDDREQGIAKSLGGVFIDLRPPWPSGTGPGWPDGTHPSTAAEQKLAELVISALQTLSVGK
jgi:lysophospholipase L1-like esterase